MPTDERRQTQALENMSTTMRHIARNLDGIVNVLTGIAETLKSQHEQTEFVQSLQQVSEDEFQKLTDRDIADADADKFFGGPHGTE